jgi:hypothetical protein
LAVDANLLSVADPRFLVKPLTRVPSSIVLIAAPDLLPALEVRVGGGPDELLTFADVDALRALQAILQKRPRAIVLEQQFAATPRGAALMTRIKADPALATTELRIISKDGDGAPPKPSPPAAPLPLAVGSVPTAVSATAVAPPLDTRGTRRAQRIPIAAGVEAVVDGNTVTLVNVSTFGAQVLSTAVLKPNQRVRVVFSDEAGVIRANATVAWASFEIPAKSGPRYRAGLEFIDAEPTQFEAYASRHRG